MGGIHDDRYWKLLGLKGIDEIIKDHNSAYNRIMEILETEGKGLVSRNDRVFPSQSYKEFEYVWINSTPPLRNTGWLPRRSEVKGAKPSGEAKCLLPTIWYKKIIVPCRSDGETIYMLPGMSITSVDWKETGREKTEVLSLSDKALLETDATSTCVQMEMSGHKLIRCGETLLGYYKHESHPEYLVHLSGGPLVFKRSVLNPIVEWIQPYTLVEDAIWVGEEIRSNYFLIIQPDYTVSLAGKKTIVLANEPSGIKVFSDSPFYFKVSYGRDHSLISNLRVLIDDNPLNIQHIPLPVIGDPTVFLHEMEIVVKEKEWIIHLGLVNITGRDRLVRIRVSPPYYIKKAIQDREEAPYVNGQNSMGVYVPSGKKIGLDIISGRHRLLAV